ncbi:MAG TPA: tetratricopeptide repeat protein, partial [Candidatus Hydrogenedentes bacterium]|nr:tetratricopeptide repeat protein [Candidatus Hydrogenedentota bacterium]
MENIMRVVWHYIGAAALACGAAWAVDTPEQAQLDFANGLFHRGFFAEAVEEYERYVADYPSGADLPTAHYRLGEAAYAVRQYEKALAAFDHVLNLPVDDAMRRQAALSRAET